MPVPSGVRMMALWRTGGSVFELWRWARRAGRGTLMKDFVRFGEVFKNYSEGKEATEKFKAW